MLHVCSEINYLNKLSILHVGNQIVQIRDLSQILNFSIFENSSPESNDVIEDYSIL